MFPRFQRGGRRRWWGGSPAAVRALGETVKRNDSGGLLFERLPACQFRCNGFFIDRLPSAAWQPSRGSMFLFHSRRWGFFLKTGSLGKLGEKVPTSSAKQLCETGNVYAPDPEKECFRSYCARILSSEVVIDCVLSRYSVYGFVMCRRAGLLCARKFYFLFSSGVCRLLTGKYRHRFKILTLPFLLKLNTLNYVINKNDPPVIQ